MAPPPPGGRRVAPPNRGRSINSTFSITRLLPGRDRHPVRAHVGHRAIRRAHLGLIRTGDHNGSALSSEALTGACVRTMSSSDVDVCVTSDPAIEVGA